MRQRILLCAIFCALIADAFTQVHPTGVVLVSEDYMRTLREKRVDPVYPQAALKDGVHGVVELQIRISKTGDIQNVRLISGDPALASSATEAVKQWSYKPYLFSGEPIAVDTKVTLSYEISSGAGVVRDAPIRTPASK
jgi:TonB family protein